jgi:hypothetical protein
MSEERLTISDSRKISEMPPYGLEPYEIEAYMKQNRVADEIRKVLGREDISEEHKMHLKSLKDDK